MAKYNRSGWFPKRPAPQAKSGSYRRKYGTSWWGRAFLTALEEADYSGRLGRGKTYANKGLVEQIEYPGPGRIRATVQGSMPTPYRIQVNWTPWPEGRREALVKAIAGDPALLGQLLTGTLPEGLVEVVRQQQLTLFPQSFAELNSECNCPDWSLPCKHIAALLYVITGAIDTDPFYLFELRGLDLRTALLPDGAVEEEEEHGLPRRLIDLLQPVGAAPSFDWNEATYRGIDLTTVTDAGWRAVRQLPASPAFAGGTDLVDLLDKLYARAERFASKSSWSGRTGTATAAELLPPGTQLELHLNADLSLRSLAAYDGEDEAVVELTTVVELFDWLLRVELLDRHLLRKSAKSLLFYFRLARRLVERRAYVPRLLETPAESYLLQYVPAGADAELNDLLERAYTLVSPTLLYYVDEAGEFFEFRMEAYGRQLLAAFIGMLVGESIGKHMGTTPVERLFYLDNPQRFDLVGTEGYPAAMHRWLDQLYLAEQRFVPVFRIEEEQAGLSVDVLVDDRENTSRQPPVAYQKWVKKAEPPAKMQVIKTLSFLADRFPELTGYLSGNGKTSMQFSVTDFTPVLTAVLPSLRALGVTILLPKALQKLLRPALGLSASAAKEVFELSGIISLDNILNFRWQAALGDQSVTEEEFRSLVGQQSGLVRFRESYVLVDQAEVRRMLEQLDAGGPELRPHERLEALFTEEYAGAPVRLDDSLRRFIAELRSAPPPPVPAGLNATLRPYQERGYAWLHQNAKLGFGSVLADDMGLGKTIQVITLLLKYYEDGLLEEEKALVIVPTSLLGNWRREIENFAPALRAHVYHGSARALPDPADYHVLLTTYGVARSEAATLGKLPWRVQVIDESQHIKNPAAKQTKAIKQIKAPVRIAMSGTPVENRLLDYWSLLDFTLPKFLGSRKHFNEHYGRPIQSDHDQRAADRFQRLTAPFVLRRLKSDKSIISDLPDKVIQTEICQLTAEQTALYESILRENMRRVEEAGGGIGRQGLILKLITALKQCCNHPAQFLHQEAGTFEQSGKALLLRERLDSILENGDKALIFTQYRAMGELLRGMLRDAFNLEVPFLHGGVSTKARGEMVDRFQNDDDCPVFLISIKAGGTGLNLTAANHVIHYDLWWNPAVEAQATDRAYRIGQERTVFVHRLVTAGTFEEKIDQLIRSKETIAGLSVVEGETSIGRMSDGELGDLVGLA